MHQSGSAGAGMPEDPILRQIAAFVLARRRMALSSAQIEALTIRLIDAFACAALARASADSRRLLAGFLTDSPTGAATLIGGGRARPDDAAFCNSWLVRKLDWNDTYIGRNGGHPSDFIGAVLAAGESAGKSGMDILRAIASGTHLMLDLCDAASAISRGWDPSTYVGLAATAAIADVLGLEETEIAHAVAMTAVSRNMLLARTGRVSAWKALASATAVRDCLFHANLARHGAPGPDPAFSGPFGFERLISGPLALELDPARDRTGDSHLKYYPAIYHAQGPLEACIALHGQIGAAPIETVNLDIYEFAIRFAADDPAKWSPRNIETADHSLPFLMAHALLRGEFGPGSLHSSLDDPAVRALAARVKVSAHADYTRRWPGSTPSRVRVCAGGQTYEKEIEHVLGHAARPIGLADVRRKFAACATPLVGAAAASQWLQQLLNFAACDTAAVTRAIASPACEDPASPP